MQPAQTFLNTDNDLLCTPILPGIAEQAAQADRTRSVDPGVITAIKNTDPHSGLGHAQYRRDRGRYRGHRPGIGSRGRSLRLNRLVSVESPVCVSLYLRSTWPGRQQCPAADGRPARMGQFSRGSRHQRSR